MPITTPGFCNTLVFYFTAIQPGDGIAKMFRRTRRGVEASGSMTGDQDLLFYPLSLVFWTFGFAVARETEIRIIGKIYRFCVVVIAFLILYELRGWFILSMFMPDKVGFNK